MPQQLSEAPGTKPHGPLDRKVPFTAYLRVVPIRGKRFETIRDLERQADTIEALLDDDVCTDLPFYFAKPVAFTRQFGDRPARFTISGHYCAMADTLVPGTPVGTQTVINSGEFKTGPSLHNGFRQPDIKLDAIVTELKNKLESIISLDVFKMEVNGVIYGEGGFHFPI